MGIGTIHTPGWSLGFWIHSCLGHCSWIRRLYFDSFCGSQQVNNSLSFYAWEICSFQQSFVLQRDEETWRALHDNKEMSHYLNYLTKSGGKRALSFGFMCNWGTSSAQRDHFAVFFRYKTLYMIIQPVYIISCTLLWTSCCSNLSQLQGGPQVL